MLKCPIISIQISEIYIYCDFLFNAWHLFVLIKLYAEHFIKNVALIQNISVKFWYQQKKWTRNIIVKRKVGRRNRKIWSWSRNKKCYCQHHPECHLSVITSITIPLILCNKAGSRSLSPGILQTCKRLLNASPLFSLSFKFYNC